jgi:hypothetical protein
VAGRAWVAGRARAARLSGRPRLAFGGLADAWHVEGTRITLARLPVLASRTGFWSWNLGLLVVAAALIFPHLHHPYPVPAYFAAAAGSDPATDARTPRLAGGAVSADQLRATWRAGEVHPPARFK